MKCTDVHLRAVGSRLVAAASSVSLFIDGTSVTEKSAHHLLDENGKMTTEMSGNNVVLDLMIMVNYFNFLKKLAANLMNFLLLRLSCKTWLRN
jgi:hypothetical protein